MAQSIWQVQEAKNKFSEMLDAALKHGPQIITRHGEKTAIVLSYAQYRKMKAEQTKLSDFFRKSPLFEVELNLKRDASLPRGNIKL